MVLRDDAEKFRTLYFGCDGGMWLAQSGLETTGCVALRPLPMPGAGEVKRLYVRPAWRRGGVADALMSSLEEYAAGAGYESLYLDSKADLEAALRFYQRRGYLPCERYNENPQATVFLRKHL